MFEFNWQSFSRRPDIVRLPINEQKRLYILEEQAFNARINYYLSMMSGTPAGDSGVPNPLNGVFTIYAGQTYTIDGTFTVNGTLNIQAGGTLIVNGSVIENGTINNDGTLTINP
jgi:hypothetical protein